MKLIFPFLLLAISPVFSQKNPIGINLVKEIVSKIEMDKGKAKKLNDFKIDSILISAKKFNGKIETQSLFLKSKTNLSIDFYFNADELILVTIKEQSPTMRDLYNHTDFYYDMGSRFYEDYYHNSRNCFPVTFDKSIYEIYGYNRYLGGEFLKKYVDELSAKL